MASIISEKVNYLAEHTDFEIFMVLTEFQDKPEVYHLSNKIKCVNLNINFDELDQMPFYKKVVYYLYKQRRYKKLLTRYMMELRPDISVSITRREINFLTRIKDGSKKIAEIHFARSYYRKLDYRFFPRQLNLWLSKLWMNSLVKNLKMLDKFIVLTCEDRHNWPELDNISVIPNFIKTIPFEKSNCNKKHVITVGRYSWQKGFDMLIEAWNLVYQKHPEWELEIYGSGDNRRYQNIADKAGLSGVVHCNPAVSNIFEHFLDSGFFVMSSRYEGLPLVLIEAMATGLPVVSFSCPCGPKDLIVNGINGFLVENGNVPQLADKIIYLIEHDNFRRDMGRNAINTISNYSIDMVMQKWVMLFDEL